MPTNAVVCAHIDKHTKQESSAVLAAMGLTVSDALGIMLTRIAHEKALPFNHLVSTVPIVLNATTMTAMKEARQGGVTSFDTVQGLMADLNADN